MTMVKIVSAVPEADVFVDGARLGKVPQQKELEHGEHFVVVSKTGYTKFEKKIVVKDGPSVVITANLKAVGGLRFLSSPSGAKVLIDGVEVGVTPFVKEDIDVGEHIISIKQKGFYDYEKSYKVEGGKTHVVNATLELIETGPTADDLVKEQRSQSSFGARTLRREKVNVDVGTGYPYYFNAGFHIGAGRFAGGAIGLDASLLIRSFFQRTELSARARVNFIDKRPFSMGAFGEVGFGNTFFDDSERNSYFFKTGLLASVTGLGRVTITGRVYLDAWTDRYCPGLDNTESDPIDLCVAYADRVENGNVGALDDATFNRINNLLDDPSGADRKLFERDGGARLLTSLIVEFAIFQRLNGWIIFEGSPLQGERPAFTDVINDFLFEEDPETYVTMGTTFKF
jgi:hypothetical protein